MQETLEKQQGEKQSVGLVKQLMTTGIDTETAKAIYLLNREAKQLDVVPHRSKDWLNVKEVGKGEDIDMKVHAEEIATEGDEQREEGVSVQEREGKHRDWEDKDKEEEKNDVEVTQTERELVQAVQIEVSPKTQQIEEAQKHIEEELKEKDEELQEVKEIIHEKTTTIVEKEEAYGTNLQERADEIQKEQADDTPQKKSENREKLEPRSTPTSIGGGVKETRILQRPQRS